MNLLYKSKVFKGEQVGRTIDFPTVNLDVTIIPKDTKQGVYASWVTVNGQTYKGALYYGPRLVFNEVNVVLEIYILDFSGDLYGQEVNFTIHDFIRPPLDFDTLDGLKAQLKADVTKVNMCLTTRA